MYHHPVALLRTTVSLRRYAIEAFLAATLMFCVEIFVVALQHPAYPAHEIIVVPWMRRATMGVLMGIVVALLCVSPWGKRSGAHFNPAVTLAFWSIDKTKTIDAICYIVSQFLGALAGIVLASMLTGDAMAHPDVDFAVTTVGACGASWAFAAEFGMSFLLMGSILWLSARPKLSGHTPTLAGALIAFFITVESPLSGMSINPTRTLSSAIMAGHVERLWLYCLAPVGGMFTVAMIYRFRRRRPTLRHPSAF